MHELSIIIISYNTCKMTLNCLKSIFIETENVDFEVIVLDNNSFDGSAEAIAVKFPQVKLIAHTENLGFAAGNNLAVNFISGEYLLLLNPDTVVLDGAIQKLLQFSKANPVALIWGGRTLFGDRSLNPGSCWRKMTLWNVFCRSFGLAWLFPNSSIFNAEAYGGWDRTTVRQVDIVSGCFFMIKRQFWEKLGGFFPEYFMYGEEADLCLRAHKLGAKPMVTPDATIIHFGGASEAVRSDKMVKLLKSKRLLIKNHWPFWQYIPGMMIYPLYPLNKVIVLKTFGLFNRRFSKEAEIWMNIWHRRKEWLN